MQTVEDGKTRMALAKEKADGLTTELGVSGKVDLYTTTPRLQRVNAAPLGAIEAKSLIGGIQANDLGDPPIDYDDALGRLARERKYERVISSPIIRRRPRTPSPGDFRRTAEVKLGGYRLRGAPFFFGQRALGSERDRE
jgi:hypothetical protein